MQLNRIELAGILASLVLVFLGGVFAFSQIAFADTDPCSAGLPGMTIFGCEDEEGGVDVPPVDPCDITPCDEDESLGEQITCEVFEELVAEGQPIPQGFDASGCDDGNGGGNDGPACADGEDNDGDTLVDETDPGCSDSNDDDESNDGGGGTTPACRDTSDNDGDGKTDMEDPGCTDSEDTDETDPSGGGSNNGGSSGGGGSGGGGGSVAGSATTTCDMYLTKFIKFGQTNDEEQVKRLQYVLKNFEGAALEENGMYDQATLTAVHAFQTKYWDTILAPWDIKESTGFVYLTTRKKVNEIYCMNNRAFPLSNEESAVIEATKKPYAGAATAKPVSAAKPAVEAEEDEEAAPAVEKKPAVQGTTRRSSWGAVGDFFRRILDRVR